MMENEAQIELWSGRSGQRWVTFQEEYDRALAPFGDAALARANPQPGERVLDVGCGCGATSIALAERVGKSGSVLGVDVSGPMLARARYRLPHALAAQVDFVREDATTFEPPRPVTLVFSRFGVMFFADPVKAFTNLRRALSAPGSSGGRLVFVCWASRDRNPWMMAPLTAATSILPPPPPPGPGDPGPFAFADPARIEAILTAAGYTNIECAPWDGAVTLGPDLEAATDFALSSGPTAALLVDADGTTRDRVRRAVREALAPYVGAGAPAPREAEGPRSERAARVVKLPASVWIVRAEN